MAYGRGRPRRAAENRTHLLSESAAGFRLVFGQPTLRAIATMIFILTAFAIVPEGLAAAWAAEGNPDDATRGFDQGLIMAASPVGYVIGGLLVGRFAGPVRRDRLVRPLALIVSYPSSPPLRARRARGGPAGGSPAWPGGLAPTLNSKFVLILPHGFRARAFGVMQAGLQLSQFAGVMITGVLAELVLRCRSWSGCGASPGPRVMLRWPPLAKRAVRGGPGKPGPARSSRAGAEPAGRAAHAASRPTDRRRGRHDDPRAHPARPYTPAGRMDG